MSTPTVVDVQGRKLNLTNLDKVLYPATGFTKGEVVDYYVRIAPVLLPHLTGRPLTMKRYPGGVDQEYFFEKNAPKHRPDWVKTAPIWSEGNNREVNYLLANDLPTLVWIANLASLELHPSLSLAKDISTPTMIVFDLDPGPPANIVQCSQVGLWVKEIFDHFGLQSFPKTSGSKGLQIYIPLNTKTSYEQTKPFAHALARLLEQEHPDLVVSDMKKAQALLESHGWKSHGDEKAQLGKDGKWQLNVYDPDLIRVELMEFKPVEKPCCSDFTAPHPSE